MGVVVYFGPPPTFSSHTHLLVVCRIRDFLLRSKVKPPSLVGVGEATRSTRGTPQGEKICVRLLSNVAVGV